MLRRGARWRRCTLAVNDYYVILECDPDITGRSHRTEQAVPQDEPQWTGHIAGGAAPAVGLRRERRDIADRAGRPFVRGDPARADRRRAAGQSPGPAACDDDLLQSRIPAMRSARQSMPSVRSRQEEHLPASITTGFQGNAQVFQEFAQGPGRAGAGRDLRLFRRARHSLRELHPSDHHPLGPAVGRRRRAASC